MALEVIKVRPDMARCEGVIKDIVKAYTDVLNGVSWACQNGGYEQGRRNTIAVNLTVAAFMLGFDPIDVLMWFMDHGLILDDMDDQSPKVRVETVMDYANRFSWSWMIDPGEYEYKGVRHADELTELKFVID